ncbi:MAG: S-methyl-5-thioribose-1-phosphate isomerase [Bacteroidetes bacterium]|nr:S-methyl-5-thioribose-1-phosphate isomerase [Bacteroidota bacterium]
MNDSIAVIELTPTGLRFLDQTRLPGEEVMVATADHRDVLEAIRALRLRGAPLIGITAAYGVTLAARAWCAAHSAPADTAAALTRTQDFLAYLHDVCESFAATRPTAVNLFWALDRMRCLLARPLAPEALTPEALAPESFTPEAFTAALEAEAHAIHDDDAQRCAAIGRHGAALLPRGAGVITHCNSGALATGGEGTAFAVLLEAHRQGRGIHVFADETRPLLQGARLTMWELRRHDIPSTLITDGTAAMLMRAGRVAAAITGADRIAANGDTANKIGTYALAVAARHHGIPFYIAAPLSTVDNRIPTGADIPIEERDPAEITMLAGRRIAPEGVHVYAPAFDVTPAELIAGFVTERGILAPPYGETLAAALS